VNRSTWYEIRVEGHLGDGWSSWLEGLTIYHEAERRDQPACTVLLGPLRDQSALHGVLIKIRDLGLPLVSLRRVGS
jgi:hypothetical protein